jgi:Hydrazine synthase alpha subunit middle domain
VTPALTPRYLICAMVILASCASVALAEDIVFAVRQPKGPHWYENFGYAVTDVGRKAYGAGGRLGRLHPETGDVKLLLDDPQGSVRDPQVHYSGRKILFSYRPAGTDHYHLYEMESDGTGLKQLTSDPFDDFEPCYLPDGGIVFCSSRCKRFVPCWYVPVATLYRCDADGQHIRPLSSNIEQDNTPWVLSDGRILYTRWEYVDRSREHFHHLWVMNPDGTGQMIFYGNMHPGNVFLDAKPIPGTCNIVMVNSPNHGRMEHEGRIAIVTPTLGPDCLAAQRLVNPAENYRDPYPLAPDSFLVAQETKLLVLDGHGTASELYRLSPDLAQGGAWLHEPRPIRSRPREPVIAPKVGLEQADGYLLVINIYQGRNMEGIRRGGIKKLLILENLPKPVNYSGSMDPISYGGSYTINRVLGTVPVEPDGSVYARVPPLRSLQLVALDENDLSVKRMLSFLTVMPGEQSACLGCHEDRTHSAFPVPGSGRPQALQRPASEITPIAGAPAIFDYPRDIQPVWDRHCLPCHDSEHYAGRVLLTGDQGPMFTHSYFMLSARLQMADGRDLARGNYAPYTIGSAASPLLDKLNGAHHGVTTSAQELRLLKLWIDAAATFPGTYAALGGGMIGSYASLEYGTKPKVNFLQWPALNAAKAVLDRRCAGCHQGDRQLPSSPADNQGLRLHHLKYGQGAPRFWTPPWVQPDAALRTGSLEWMKKYADPKMQFSHNILYNLSCPERSVQLLAPLSKAAGGYGICGEVLSTTADPDYQTLLAGIEEALLGIDNALQYAALPTRT